MPRFNNGGFVGKVATTPTISSAPGKWGVSDQHIFRQQNIWPGLPITTNGLQLYLDATVSSSYSGSGTTWNDLSGNNRNFSWVSNPSFTGGAIPYFSTLGNACRGPASNSFGINNTSGYTIFFSMYQNSLASTGALKFYSSNGTGSQSRGIFAHATWSDSNVYFDQGGCCGTDTRTNVAISGATGSWNFIALRSNYAGTERSIWQNGSKIASNTSAIANINLNSTAVDFGSSDEYGGSSSTWDARTNMFIVYNRGLSDSEMSDVYNALKSKIGR